MYKLPGMFLLFFSLLFFSTPGSFPAQAQHGYSTNMVNGYKVVRGERPEINLEKISADAFESGRIYIRFSPGWKGEEFEKPITAGALGYVLTGVSRLDSLNRRFSVTRYIPVLEGLYETPALQKNQELHRAWGFNLWYELKLDAGSDILEAVKQYSMLDEVEIAEPVYRIEQMQAVEKGHGPREGEKDKTLFDTSPNDPYYGTHQWHYNNTGQIIGGQAGIQGVDIDLEAAWVLEKGNPAVIVAVIDTQIDYLHEDISGNMWENIGPGGASDLEGIGSHGTHVAGTVAAMTSNGLGVAGIAGGSGDVNGVKLMSIPSIGYSQLHLSPLGIYLYAAANGAAITQNSWYYPQPGTYNQLALDGIDFFNTYGGGTALLDGGITIFAAGNESDETPYYPACYSGSIAVAAYNNRGEKASWSNFGSWIDISAPGEDVFSSIAGNDYGYASGTSMACPHVSGVAALVLSHVYSILTPAQLRQILLDNTDDIYVYNPEYAGKLGSGGLNAFKALMAAREYLPEVENVNSFTASPLCTSSINLQWESNINHDPVMLVWSPGGLFHKPQDLQEYFPGDTLGGKSIVLYYGNDQKFIHDDLPQATTYNYRIYSVSQQGNYSPGMNARAQTDCGIFTRFPYTQPFDLYNEPPPCWEVTDNASSGIHWQFGTRTAGLIGTGSYAFVAKKGNWNGFQDTDLISPVFDFTGHIDIRLSFLHSFAQYSSNNDTAASLFWSADDGQSWTILYQLTSNVIPSSLFSMPLPQLEGQSNVRFKWKAYGNFINFWEIDNFQITATPVTYTGEFTFNVDMSQAEGFDPEIHGVFLTGNFTGWAEPGQQSSIELEPGSERPLIYTVTLDSLPEIILQYNYFSNLNGEGWQGSEWEQGPHRVMDPRGVTMVNDSWGDFQPSYFNVSLLADTDAGTLTGAGENAAGLMVNIRANAASNYLFRYWTDDNGVITSYNPNYSFQMPARDIQLYAVFTTTTNVNDIHSREMIVYPNPFAGEITVSNASRYQSFRLLNLAGQTLLFQEANGGDYQRILTAHLPAGIYILSAIDPKGNLFSSKLVKH